MKKHASLRLMLLFTLGGVGACGGAGPLGGDGDLAKEPAKPAVQNPRGDQPPPVSGGTLLVSRDDQLVVAADPDRDAVWLVDAARHSLRARVNLAAGAEPGRVIEDQDGKIHVALRGAGQVAKIDPQSGAVIELRPACPAPRGMAYDAASDNLHVACAGGELVTMKARGGEIVRTLRLDRDLRDIVLSGDHLLISRFRSAELLEIDGSGSVLRRGKPRQTIDFGQGGPMTPAPMPVTASPTTAWRTVGLPSGEVLMLHQRASDGTVSTRRGGYGGGGCKGTGIVSSGLTTFSSGTAAGNGATIGLAGLVVDVAVSRDGQKLALIGPSASPSSAAAGPFGAVLTLNKTDLGPSDHCSFPSPMVVPTDIPAELIAGAYDGTGQLFVQSREPAQIHILVTGSVATSITLLTAESKSNQGHKIFHTLTPSAMACASCHAEAGDDGHVWTFDTVGPRRTQSLRGGLLATAPFHWDGDMDNLNQLMQEVFFGRMSGPPLGIEQIAAVGTWLDVQPALPKAPPRDAQAVARGHALFNDATVGCASCHVGAHFTTVRSFAVGTGERAGQAFQVPSLIDVAARAPYLHNGCAATLRDRFDPACGGGDSHGKTAQLGASQLDDLTAYLETL